MHSVTAATAVTVAELLPSLQAKTARNALPSKGRVIIIDLSGLDIQIEAM